MMFPNKLKTATLLPLLVAGFLAFVKVLAAPGAAPQAPTGALPTTSKPMAPTDNDPPARSLSRGPNKLLFFKSGELSLIDPDGKNEKVVIDRQTSFPAGMGVINPVRIQLSPDGKKLAVLLVPKIDTNARPVVTNPKATLYLKELAEKSPWIDLEIKCETVTWAPDCNQLAVTDWTLDTDKKRRVAVHHLVDVTTREKKKVDLPDNQVITDWSSDRKHLLTYSMTVKDNRPVYRLHLMNLDGTESKVLSDEKQNVGFGRISKDGTRVLCARSRTPAGTERQPVRPRGGEVELLVLDIASGKTTPVADLPQNALLLGYCWSPEGTQIAYTWRQVHEGDSKETIRKETESHLIVCDADGKNQKTVASVKASVSSAFELYGVDWR
jgi:dipeptidyl aminopeptidase/acylaminoacyl peptidase